MANFLTSHKLLDPTKNLILESSEFKLSNSKLVTAKVVLQLAFLGLLLLTFAPSLLTIFHRRRQFALLPQLPKMGIFGRWLLGNIDLYFYVMRHLTIEEGKREKNVSLKKLQFIFFQRLHKPKQTVLQAPLQTPPTLYR